MQSYELKQDRKIDKFCVRSGVKKKRKMFVSLGINKREAKPEKLT